MEGQFSRTELIVGKEAVARLKKARVAVFGLGGVGSYVVEALARSGIGALDLVDDDMISVSNMNRQLLATWSSVGQAKVEAARERVRIINPRCLVRTYMTFYAPETASQFLFTHIDYIVDCIDTVTGKLALIQRAHEAGVPIISVMGTGNKLDPTAFVVTDISKTDTCPLARIMRKELKKRGISHLKVVYSTEEAVEPIPELEEALLAKSRKEPDPGRGEFTRRSIPGSMPFVPGVAGLIAAGEVIKGLMKEPEVREPVQEPEPEQMEMIGEF